jgi:hydrogenase-1 operon protein HyaE
MNAAPPAIARLATAPLACWVDTETVDAFLARAGDAVLFLWSDPVRFPECLDVAVVLPELRRHVGTTEAPRFRIGVVDAAAEEAVARRYGATRRPALVFVRDGQYVATIAGMHDWKDFLCAVHDALAAPVTRAPSVGIPVVAAEARAGCA